jgi:hypothetical protein
MGKNKDPGLPTRIIFPRAYKQFFGLKKLKFFDADAGWKKFRSGINIPDPQHWRRVEFSAYHDHGTIRKLIGK